MGSSLSSGSFAHLRGPDRRHHFASPQTLDFIQQIFDRRVLSSYYRTQPVNLLAIVGQLLFVRPGAIVCGSPVCLTLLGLRLGVPESPGSEAGIDLSSMPKDHALLLLQRYFGLPLNLLIKPLACSVLSAQKPLGRLVQRFSCSLMASR